MTESKKYKYKTEELDSELFKKNLLSNYESYVKHQGYKGDELNQFKTSFDNYLKAFDQGTLSTEYDGSVTDTSGSLRNEGFDQHVAKYFNVIGNALSQKMAKKDAPKKTKFSLSEHGFLTDFGKHIAPSGNGDLEAWLNQDAYDEKTQKRGLTNRVIQFNNFLDQYIANFGDYDFEGSAFKSKEDYLERLKKVKEALADNTLSENEYLILNQAGFDPNFYKAAFTTSKTYTPTEQEAAQQALQQQKDWKAKLKQIRADYDANPYHANALHTGYYKPETWDETQEHTESDMRLVSNFKRGLNTQNNNYALNYMLNRMSEDVTEGKYKGWKSIADTYDDKSKSIMVINPTTHRYERAFIGDVNDYFHKYLQDQQQKLNPDSWMSNYSYAIYHKQGGKFQEGGNIEVDEDEAWIQEQAAKERALYQENLSKRAKASGNTEEYQKSMERHVLSGRKNVSDPDSNALNFSTEDYIDLGTLAADIYSGLSDPITGTVAGVTSSLVNFGTDLSRGKGLWESTKGLGTNLLFDAISIVPVLGDAVGSGGKVVSKLAKWAPKVLTALSTGRMLAGLGESGSAIIKSFEKIGKEGPDNELTAQDFKNILSGLNMVIQGGKGLSSAHSKSKATKAAEMPDNVDVKVTQNGQTKILRFGGDEAKKIKTLKTPEEIKNFIVENHKSYKDIEIQTKSDGMGGSQWIWSRDKGDGTKRSFWDIDNLRSPYRQAGQTADISTVDYDKLRRTQFDYRWGRHLRSGNNNTERIGARGLGERGQDIFSTKSNIEVVKQARKRKAKADKKVETPSQPDYYVDPTEIFWDKQGGILIPKAEEGYKLVGNGKYRRYGKGTSEDPYRFEAVEGTGAVIYDENQEPIVTNEQFLPKKEEILQYLGKLAGEDQTVNVQPYVKPENSKNTPPIKENPLSDIKLSKIARLAKFTSTLDHNKKQEELALAIPTRYDEIAQLTEMPIIGQYDLNIASEQQAANLMNVAKNSATTDSLQNREILLKAAIAGNEGKMKQAIAENAAIASARTKNAEIRNQNELMRVQGANINNAYQLKKLDDDYGAKAARMRADWESTTNALDNLITKDLEPKELEQQEARDSVKLQNYQTEIIQNPAAHGLQFDAATTKLVQDVSNGSRKVSDLSEDEQNIYNRALIQINQMLKVKKARDKHLTLNFNPTPIESDYKAALKEEDGGKITIAKIRKKIEKAKLLQRQLEEKMKNYQKDLDRLSKRPDTYKKEK